MFSKYVPLWLAPLMWVSCVDNQDIATPEPSPMMAEVSGKPLDQLKEGHEIFRTHCVQCHENRIPSTVTLPEYHQKISVMAGRAQLTPSQEKALQLYLDEFSDR